MGGAGRRPSAASASPQRTGAGWRRAAPRSGRALTAAAAWGSVGARRPSASTAPGAGRRPRPVATSGRPRRRVPRGSLAPLSWPPPTRPRRARRPRTERARRALTRPRGERRLRGTGSAPRPQARAARDPPPPPRAPGVERRQAAAARGRPSPGNERRPFLGPEAVACEEGARYPAGLVRREPGREGLGRGVPCEMKHAC